MFAIFLLSLVIFTFQTTSFTVLPLTRVSKSSIGLAPLSNQATPVNITDVREYAYLADIGIGGQPLPVIVDTGSYDLWVASSNCSASDCNGIKKYTDTPTLQITVLQILALEGITLNRLQNETFNIKYLTGSVSGNIAYESVSVGEYLVLNQVLALASEPKDVGLASVGNSGIMGLAFPRVAAISLQMGQNFISNVLDHLDADSRCFGVRLGRDGQGSALIIGSGSNNGSFPDPKTLPLMDVYSADGKNFDYWKLPLTAVLWGESHTPLPLGKSKLVESSNPIGVFDTGTTLILGPSDDVRQFWINVGGARQATDGTWQVRCELAVEMGFVFGNITVSIDPIDLSWSAQQSPDGWCDGGVQANDQVIGGDWLLGDTFLRNTYIAHCVTVGDRPPQIGLVPLTDPSTSLDTFRSVRGSLSVIPSTSALALPITSNQPESLWISILAPLIGFLAGSGTIALWRLWCSRRRGSRNRNRNAVEDYEKAPLRWAARDWK